MSTATPFVNVFARYRPPPLGAPTRAAIPLPRVRSIVDAEQLVAWAQREDARATLPLLVRRVIHARATPTATAAETMQEVAASLSRDGPGIWFAGGVANPVHVSSSGDFGHFGEGQWS